MSTESFGPALRFWRTNRNMSLTELAHRVHYNKGHLSRIERGTRPPTIQIAQACDAVLDADGALRALAEPRIPTPRGRGTELDGALGQIDDAVAALLGDGHSLHVAAGEKRTLRHFQSLLLLLREQGRQCPPSVVLPSALVQARVLSAMADVAEGAARVGLLTLAAQYFEYAGWMAQESGDDAAAVQLTAAAVRLGTSAGAPQLAAYALVRAADLALGRGEADRVIALAHDVERDTAATPRVRAMGMQRAAQGHALVGNTRACEAALARATDLLAASRASQEDPVPLGAAATSRVLGLVRGWCYYDLGRPEQAVVVLGTGLARVPKRALRARALYGARLSMAHVAAGEVAAGCQLVEQVIDQAEQVDSATVRQQLSQLGEILARWSHRQSVRRVQARLAGVLSS